MARVVTLKQVAAVCGISVSTASRALRSDGRMARETLERVREAARKLKYVPDPLLASLASRRFKRPTGQQGTPVVYLTRHGGEIGRRCAIRFRHAREVLETLGYGCTHHAFQETENLQTLFRRFHARGVRGILLGPWQGELFPDAGWERFAVAGLESTIENLPFHEVTRDHFADMCELWGRLRARGCRRIAVLLRNSDSELVDDWLRVGAALACGARDGGLCSGLPLIWQMSPGWEERIRGWHRRHRPDGWVLFDPWIYDSLTTALGAAEVPEDRAVCVVLPREGSRAPRLEGLAPSRLELDKAAAHLIDRLIRHGEMGPPRQTQRVRIKSAWCAGAASRPH